MLDGQRAAFVSWAKSALVALPQDPVSPGEGARTIAEWAADAPVVALSEALHDAAEPLQVRNSLFRHLVEKKGFSAIAIESGIVEGRQVNEYILNGRGDIDTALREGLSWTFDRLEHNRALIEWLREHNWSSRCARPVHFYGFDVPGSPGESEAVRGVDTALKEVMQYLTRVDRVAACRYESHLAPFWPNLSFDLRRAAHAGGYDRLSLAERDRLTAIVSDLVTLIERREAEYAEGSGAGDYTWAHRAVLGARQVDGWLRQIPIGWLPIEEPMALSLGDLRFLNQANDVRDRAQADNLAWILEQEASRGGVLVFGHRYHLSKAAVRNELSGRTHPTMGSYLAKRLGRRFVSIGTVIGRSELAESGWLTHSGGSEPSVDRVAAGLGVPEFLLDLRNATGIAREWLDREQPLEYASGLSVAPGHAFDALLYVDVATPAPRA